MTVKLNQLQICEYDLCVYFASICQEEISEETSEKKIEGPVARVSFCLDFGRIFVFVVNISLGFKILERFQKKLCCKFCIEDLIPELLF